MGKCDVYFRFFKNLNSKGIFREKLDFFEKSQNILPVFAPFLKKSHFAILNILIASKSKLTWPKRSQPSQ